MVALTDVFPSKNYNSDPHPQSEENSMGNIEVWICTSQMEVADPATVNLEMSMFFLK